MTSQTARFVPYKTVLDGFMRRRGHGKSNAPDEDALLDAAEYLTSGYRRCLEKYPWPELNHGETVACTDGLVTWAAVQGSDLANVEFWTADPEAPNSTACKIALKRYDSTGFMLDTTLEEVWAYFTPRAPEFRHEPVVPTDTYALEDVVYDSVTGHMYLCLEADAEGSELDEPTKWVAMPLLGSLADATKWLALADATGNGEHERAQAATLIRQAEDLLDDLATRELRAAGRLNQ